MVAENIPATTKYKIFEQYFSLCITLCCRRQDVQDLEVCDQPMLSSLF